MKIFINITIILLLSACGEQDFTEDEVLTSTHGMLKFMCENRQSCIDQLEQAAVECKSKTSPNVFPAEINIDPHAQVAVGFQMCIFEQMDEAFMAKFNQVFPVTQTEVKISRPSEYDPKVLKIEEVDGQLEILGQLVAVENFKDFVKANNLSAHYESVLFNAAEGGDIGLMITTNQAVTDAGFKRFIIGRTKP